MTGSMPGPGQSRGASRAASGARPWAWSSFAGGQWTGVVGFLKRSEPVRGIWVDIRRSVDPLTRHFA